MHYPSSKSNSDCSKSNESTFSGMRVMRHRELFQDSYQSADLLLVIDSGKVLDHSERSNFFYFVKCNSKEFPISGITAKLSGVKWKGKRKGVFLKMKTNHTFVFDSIDIMSGQYYHTYVQHEI